MTSVVTRFAPSPTGLLHAGNYRTAVFAYLYAKHVGGEFIVRIEDTDRERSKSEYEANIFESLEWLGLPYEKKYRQSESAPRHRELLEKLIAEGKAYVSKETPKEKGDREEVIRFKNSGGEITFTDMMRGEITIDVTDLKDFVLARSLDEPVFHFAVVVDDADEGVTHVIRGDDHISNTPRQILIQRALGFATPAYAHLPLVLDTDRTKLSKRKGAKALTEYRDMGFLPEAMLNYLAFLGWNPGDEREYMTKEELTSAFDLARVHTGAAIFDEKKLRSVNQHWMRQLSDADFITRGGLGASDNTLLLRTAPLIKERAQTFEEARELLTGELSCIFTTPVLDKAALTQKEPAEKKGKTGEYLSLLSDRVAMLPDASGVEEIKAAIMPYADQEGRGAVLWPLRYALSGEERSPDPFSLIAILGKKEAQLRIQNAIGILSR